MLNYEDFGKGKKKVKSSYRKPPKGKGFFIYKLDDEDNESFIAYAQDPSYARTMVENLYLPKTKEGTRFIIRKQPEDTLVVKVMNFEGKALTTTPLGGLGKL